MKPRTQFCKTFFMLLCVIVLVIFLPGAAQAAPGETPALSRPLAKPAQVTGVTMLISPGAKSVLSGDQFTVTVQIQAGSQSVDTAQASLDFDPTYLKVVQITAGTALVTQLQNQYDNTTGTIDFGAGSLPPATPATGTFTLVQIKFQALAQTAGTALIFHTGAPRVSGVYYQGNLLAPSGSAVGGSVTIDPGSAGPVALALSPSTKAASTGSQFTLTVQVKAGIDVVDAASAYLDFDPNYLKVVQITPGTALATILQNQYDNGAGTVDYSAGLLPPEAPATGTFTLYKVKFQALSTAGVTQISIHTGGTRDSGVFYTGTAMLPAGAVSGCAVTISPMNISASVTLQGRAAKPSAAWSVPLTVTFTTSGQSTPTYTFTDSADTYGQISYGGVAPGIYDIRVKNSHTLRAKLTGVTLVSGTNTINFGTLLEGDANDDNYVTMLDFSILASTYNKCQGTSGYDDRADFNEDQCVTTLDFSLLVASFGKAGY